MSSNDRVCFNDVFLALSGETGFEFDDAWDTLRIIDASYVCDVGCLMDGLKDNSVHVRHYCLRAFQKIGVIPIAARDRIAGAISDSNKLVRIEAIGALGKILSVDPGAEVALCALRCAVKDRRAPVEVRLRAWWMLRKRASR